VRLRCGEDSREVAVRETRDGLQVVVDGASFGVEVSEVAPGTFLAKREGRLRTFHCVRQGGEVHLFWEGAVYRLLDEGEQRRPVQRGGGGGLEAPMPGKVMKVVAVPGQRVRKGEEVLVVEAMKMENAVRAPRDGVVKSVAVRVGDAVIPGVVLVELE
jgi:3-methylcrotonyl-CoA carboxylase alpha subunit